MAPYPPPRTGYNKTALPELIASFCDLGNPISLWGRERLPTIDTTVHDTHTR